jgi:hypothetical protein
VVARGQHGIFKEAGYGAHDVTWAIVTFADGAVINLGVSYALPARYPTLGQSDRLELLGSEGTMIIDDDHMDHLLFSEKGIPHAYVPDHTVNMAFLGSNTAGDWAVGDFWGPLGNETRAWLDHLATGAPTVHTTPAQARINLETTIAIERAWPRGKVCACRCNHDNKNATLRFDAHVLHGGGIGGEFLVASRVAVVAEDVGDQVGIVLVGEPARAVGRHQALGEAVECADPAGGPLLTEKAALEHRPAELAVVERGAVAIRAVPAIDRAAAIDLLGGEGGRGRRLRRSHARGRRHCDCPNGEPNHEPRATKNPACACVVGAHAAPRCCWLVIGNVPVAVKTARPVAFGKSAGVRLLTRRADAAK